MVDAYKSAPVAYTLDIGIVNRETIVIEAHNFYSVGFYGFSDNRLIPFMLSQWWNEYNKVKIPQILKEIKEEHGSYLSIININKIQKK